MRRFKSLSDYQIIVFNVFAAHMKYGVNHNLILPALNFKTPFSFIKLKDYIWYPKRMYPGDPLLLIIIVSMNDLLFSVVMPMISQKE